MTLTSAWSRVTCPTARSMAQPPVIHQGTARPDSSEPTACTGSKPALRVVFIMEFASRRDRETTARKRTPGPSDIPAFAEKPTLTAVLVQEKATARPTGDLLALLGTVGRRIA